jgi:hypothetical protein
VGRVEEGRGVEVVVVVVDCGVVIWFERDILQGWFWYWCGVRCVRLVSAGNFGGQVGYLAIDKLTALEALK